MLGELGLIEQNKAWQVALVRCNEIECVAGLSSKVSILVWL